MQREIIIQSVQEIPSETRVRAWVFQIEKKFYHVAEYDGYRRPSQTSIWESTKKGKRLSEKEIFTTEGKDHMKCVNAFLDSLGILS